MGRRASAFWKAMLAEAIARKIVPLSLVPDSLRESRLDLEPFPVLAQSGGQDGNAVPAEPPRCRIARTDSQSTQDTFWTVASAFANTDAASTVDRTSWVSRESAVIFDDRWMLSHNKDFTKLLPPEILDKVFGYVPYKALLQCQLVSRNWRDVTNSNTIWREKYAQEWGLSPTVTTLPSGKSRDWRRLYEVRTALDRNMLNSQYASYHLEGHKDGVYCAKFDNKEILTGSRDNTLKVWDFKTRKQLHSLDGYGGSVLCMAMDDKIVVSGSSDTRCLIYDRKTYRQIGKLEFHDAPVLDVALTGSRIISAGKDGRIAVWRRRDMHMQYYLKAHRGPVNAVAVCGSTFLTAGADGLIKQWSTATGEHIQTLRGHTRGLACIDVSSCARYAVLGSNDRTLRIWNMETGESRCLEGHLDVVRSVCISGSRVISGSYDSMIKVWDLRSGKFLSEYRQPNGNSVFCVRANARYIVATSVGVHPTILDFGATLGASAPNN